MAPDARAREERLQQQHRKDFLSFRPRAVRARAVVEGTKGSSRQPSAANAFAERQTAWRFTPDRHFIAMSTLAAHHHARVVTAVHARLPYC